jgi:hypothetical protein
MRINTHVTHLQFACQDYQKIVDDIHAGAPGAEGRSFEEIFSGLPHTFAADVMAAIRAAAPLVAWDYDAAFPGGKEGKPTPLREVTLLPPNYVTDANGVSLATKRI